MSESRSKSVLGGKKSESKKKSKHSDSKKPDEIHIRKGASGGFIAKHHHKANKDDGNTPDSSEHVLSDLSQLHDHIDDQMGDQPDAGTAPAAAPVAPPPAAGPAGPAAPMAAPAGM